MVVDDELPIREWIVYSIQKQKQPFQVVGVASSGQEAYELAMKHKPDVIVTDIKMPGMDGIELMQEVKKILPYTTFIILTNYADFTYAKQAITYGAKQYLLKSEMRGEDLGEALLGVLEEKTQITTQKNKDMLANGYIDLYSLYNNFEQEDYSRQFWEQYQMKEGKPYVVLALEEDKACDQKNFLIQEVEACQVDFFIMAIRHGIIYILLQQEEMEQLERSSQGLMQQIYEKTGRIIASGRCYTALNQSLQAIEEAELALGYHFFTPKQSCLAYLKLCHAPRLNPIALREAYYEILEQVSLKLYDQARQLLEEWFGKMKVIHIQDTSWVKEMCQRMLISIEERYYHLHLEQEEGWGQQTISSLEAYEAACKKMLVKMAPQTNREGSMPIDRALQYMHQHYNENLSLAEVAQEVFLSPEYFSRLFKEEVGENFSVYLMLYRLKRAKELLIQTELRVSEIAHRVGYGTPGYFSKIYKKYMGVSPDEERGVKSRKNERS